MALTGPDSALLRGILKDDAKDHFYSASTSLVDAIRGLDAGFYTWSTVKCYYSVFYSVRALLALAGTCIVYVPRSKEKVSSFWIDCVPGGRLKSEKESGTHKLALLLFSKRYNSHRLLSNPIDGELATNWLMERRDESNYRRARFQEPDPPEHFLQVYEYGTRRLITTYLDDQKDSYTFQKDHAMLAYPLAALIQTGSALKKNAGIGMDDDELRFLVEECCDDVGPITPLTNIFKGLCL